MKNLSGIYLVVDPTMDWNTLPGKLKAALDGGLQIIQIWNHWKDDISYAEKLEFVEAVKNLGTEYNAPVLMHDDWRMAIETNLDGVHFDEIPEDFLELQSKLHDKYIGITVGNETDKIQWADDQNLSYISFCAVFPSSSVDTCTIVDREVIRRAQETTQLPVFLSGGIQHDNLEQLKELHFDGIAIISGILSAEDPKKAVEAYKQKLEEIQGAKID